MQNLDLRSLGTELVTRTAASVTQFTMNVSGLDKERKMDV